MLLRVSVLSGRLRERRAKVSDEAYLTAVEGAQRCPEIYVLRSCPEKAK